MANEGQSSEAVLQELHDIKKLLISMLIVSGVEAKTIAKVLKYKGISSISNEIPVRELQKPIPVRLQETAGK
jgi:hypothetical protein